MLQCKTKKPQTEMLKRGSGSTSLAQLCTVTLGEMNLHSSRYRSRGQEGSSSGVSAVGQTLHQFGRSTDLRFPGGLAQLKGKLDPEGC